MKLFGLTGVWAYVAAGVLALALVATIVLGVTHCKKIDQETTNQQINSGELIERGNSAQETINAVKNANEARNTPTGNELNVVCSKYDRNCSHSS